MSAGRPAPVLLARDAGYRLRGRVHFPQDAIRDVQAGMAEELVVFRKEVLDPTEAQPEGSGGVFTVRFRFPKLSTEASRRKSRPRIRVARDRAGVAPRWM